MRQQQQLWQKQQNKLNNLAKHSEMSGIGLSSKTGKAPVGRLRKLQISNHTKTAGGQRGREGQSGECGCFCYSCCYWGAINLDEVGASESENFSYSKRQLIKLLSGTRPNRNQMKHAEQIKVAAQSHVLPHSQAEIQHLRLTLTHTVTHTQPHRGVIAVGNGCVCVEQFENGNQKLTLSFDAE